MSMMMSMFKNFKMQGANMEIFRFAVCISMPMCLMIYIGSNTHDKLNVPDFWPDPARLNQIPKDRFELKQEIARMRKERLERQARRHARLAAQEAEV